MNIEDFIKNIPLSTGCEVVKFDECGLIAINKKAGRASHPNPVQNPNAKPPMLRAPYNFKGEYYSWTPEGGEKTRLYLINRLDSPTSGIIIVSAREDVAKLAKEEFRQRRVKKIYRAICAGKNFQKRGTWVDFMAETGGAGFVRAAGVNSGGRKTECDFEAEQTDVNGANLTLLRLEPHTGFTHQLRVQCANRKMPVLGDATYGDFALNKKIRSASKINRLFLHCSKTELNLTIDGKKIQFCAEAPLPQSFEKIMGFNNDIAKLFRKNL